MSRIARLPIYFLLVVPWTVQSQSRKISPADHYDVAPPEIVCPANTTVVADSTGTAYLGEFLPVRVVDESTSSPFIMQSPVPCTLLKVQDEAYLVTLIAIDDNHNAAACSFRVTIKSAGSRQQAAATPTKAEDGM
ncbi:MAG: HYR domain-containing protein [Saprospiraceae bacterium]|nr:HYR domain-containing protein [Saprospiraceae bacterium]